MKIDCVSFAIHVFTRATSYSVFDRLRTKITHYREMTFQISQQGQQDVLPLFYIRTSSRAILIILRSENLRLQNVLIKHVKQMFVLLNENNE